MSLACQTDVDIDDPSCFAWMWSSPTDHKPLQTKRSRKCCSCENRIALSDECIEFPRARTARTDIEERIHEYNWHDAIGEGAVPLASWYMCDRCGHQAHALLALGFTFDLGDSMQELVTEYKVQYQGVDDPCGERAS